jgi:hypothetical protein
MRYLSSVWFMIGTGSLNTRVHEVLRLSLVHDWYRFFEYAVLEALMLSVVHDWYRFFEYEGS